ncbi:MAG: YabP/YqfC family sporulation protein [Oscillospiraceae bacterium]|nr:YabP/YqfC family sporulation protein [Oscillospiraceae bacterium]
MDWKQALRRQDQPSAEVRDQIPPGQPRIELLGRGEFWMEGHKGILSYGEEEIHISGGKMVVCLRGRELELRVMTAHTLCISGRITSLELE